jgi:hypothetical protein
LNQSGVSLLIFLNKSRLTLDAPKTLSATVSPLCRAASLASSISLSEAARDCPIAMLTSPRRFRTTCGRAFACRGNLGVAAYGENYSQGEKLLVRHQ